MKTKFHLPSKKCHSVQIPDDLDFATKNKENNYDVHEVNFVLWSQTSSKVKTVDEGHDIIPLDAPQRAAGFSAKCLCPLQNFFASLPLTIRETGNTASSARC